jgi:hypothetical protein
MQPEMMIALANHVQRDRESEPQRVLPLPLPVAKRAKALTAHTQQARWWSGGWVALACGRGFSSRLLGDQISRKRGS